MKQLIINNKKSYDDFGVYIASRNISSPKKKVIKETIPFTNNVYDFSNINGEVYWEERKLQYTFDVAEITTEEMEVVKSKLLNWLLNVHDDDIYDPYIGDYHFHGSYDSDSWSEDFGAGELSVSFTVYPYKISNSDEHVIEYLGYSNDGVLTNSVNSNLVGLKIDGLSTQETRSGKNLFNKDNVTLNARLNISGANYSEDEESKERFISDYIKVKSNDIYTISYTPNRYDRISFYDENKVFISNNDSLSTFTTPENAHYIRFSYLQTMLDSTQLEQGPLASEYEPYGVMPSPDYPSEIENVEGYNLLDVSKVTDEWINPSGSVGTSTVTKTTDYIPVKVNQSYIFSYNYDTLVNSNNKSICLYNENKEVVTGGKNYNPTSKEVLITPTVDGYVRLSYDVNAYDVQLTKGTTTKPYLPYNHIGIKTTGKNLFNINNISYLPTYDKFNPILTVVDSNNFTMENGRSDDWNGVYVTGLDKTKTYTISFDVTLTSYNKEADIIVSSLRNGDNRKTLSLNTTTHITYTFSDSDCVYIRQAPKVISKYSKVQLEVNDLETSYEAYKETITPLLLDEPLRSLPNGVRDTYENGVITRRVGKVVLDGSETITMPNENQFNIDNLSNFDYKKIYGGVTYYCSHYEGIGQISSNGEFKNLASDHDYCFDFSSSSNTIRFKNVDISTIDEFKAWLSENNVELIYELATPTTETVDFPSVPTYASQTNVSIQATLETTFEVSYNEKRIVTINNDSSHRVPVTLISDGNFTITTLSNLSKNLLNVPSSYELTGAKLYNPIHLKAGTYKITNSSIVTTGKLNKHLIIFNGANNKEKSLYLVDKEGITFTVDFDVISYHIYSQNGYSASTGVTTIFNELMISKEGGLYEPYQGIESSYSIGEGTYTDGAYLEQGENELTIVGSGNLILKYKEEKF